MGSGHGETWREEGRRRQGDHQHQVDLLKAPWGRWPAGSPETCSKTAVSSLHERTATCHSFYEESKYKQSHAKDAPSGYMQWRGEEQKCEEKGERRPLSLRKRRQSSLVTWAMSSSLSSDSDFSSGDRALVVGAVPSSTRVSLTTSAAASRQFMELESVDQIAGGLVGEGERSHAHSCTRTKVPLSLSLSLFPPLSIRPWFWWNFLIKGVVYVILI